MSNLPPVQTSLWWLKKKEKKRSSKHKSENGSATKFLERDPKDLYLTQEACVFLGFKNGSNFSSRLGQKHTSQIPSMFPYNLYIYM